MFGSNFKWIEKQSHNFFYLVCCEIELFFFFFFKLVEIFFLK